MLSISSHTHCESKLTGSTLENLVKRAKDLKRTHFSYTDHGHLSSCLKAYGLAKKADLKFAAGLEFYFKDSSCPFVPGTPADRCRYFTSTVYATTQQAYQELCKIISKEDFPTTEIYEEKRQLWDWTRLEYLSKLETLLVLGGPHCMVGKVLLAHNEELAEKIFVRLHELFGLKLYSAITCTKWGKKYANVVQIKYKDGTHDSLLSTDLVSTDKAKKIKAIDLYKRSGHSVVESKTVAMTHFSVGKEIAEVLLHKGFLPLPGGDIILTINKFLHKMSKKYGVGMVLNDYAYYATKEDKVVQTMVLGGSDKLYSDLHMKTQEEFEEHVMSTLGIDVDETAGLVESTNQFASKFDNFSLKYEWRLADVGENPLKQCMEIISKKGRMKWDNPTYVSRLREEIEVIARNPVKDFSGYFLPIHDVINHYTENNQLTGPGRGSAGGSLILYLMGITQLDPIKYGLSFPRFLSLDRLKNGDIPDVDSDFPDRELLVGKDGKSGYLYGRWGDKAAQISTRHTVRLKSAILDTNRYLYGTVQPEIAAFSKSLPDPPQGVSDPKFIFGYKDTDGNSHPGLIETYEPLQFYVKNRPAEWDIVQKSVGITRAHSQHPSAFVLSDTAIADVLPVKEGHITQYEAKACEAARLIKYDFLVVLNIKDIEVCLKLINKKNNETNQIGYFTHKGEKQYVWDLPSDGDVFRSIWNGDTQTLFQINTKSMIPFVKEICPESVEDISTILALVRPGPMDYINEETGRSMAEEYVSRRQGKSEPDLKELYDLIPETHGVIVFQEQSIKISKELGGMTPSDAEKLRRIFSKKLKVEALEMKPTFMSTAMPKIGQEKAEKIWNMMETASRYSFNCVDGNQKIKTSLGFVELRTIVENPDKFQVAFMEMSSGLLKYENPDFVADKGIKECWVVELDDGSTISATPDHKFLSNGAWKTLEEIVDGGLALEAMKQRFVKKILTKKNVNVYDISMPSDHNFILENGIVAHNCSHSTAYALITYAGMFLMHHYPLEWWAAILTNATEKEISGKLWTHVRDIVAPPDINLSTDEMVVDYANEKIRAKLGVIRGMGDATINPIVDGRPYKDIQDFVDKEVAGASLSKKLIHIGVLDSLFPAKSNFIQKLQLYEDAIEVRNYRKKVEKAKEEGKTIRATQPKRGLIDQDFVELEKDPMKSAAAKKAVLPTIMVNLFDLACHHSKYLKPGILAPSRVVQEPFRRLPSMLLSGEELARLDQLSAETAVEDKYIAATGYVVDMKEFQFKNKTRSALKIVVDFDGYSCEKVVWPDYNSQQLEYPKDLKKGSIVTFFLKKRAGKNDPTNIVKLYLES